MCGGQLYAYAYYEPTYAYRNMHTQTCLKNPNLETQKHIKQRNKIKMRLNAEKKDKRLEHILHNKKLFSLILTIPLNQIYSQPKKND